MKRTSIAILALCSLAACTIEPANVVDRPSFYLEKLLYALGRPDQGANDNEWAADLGYDGLARNKHNYKKLVENYTESANIIAPFTQSSNSAISKSATAAKAAFTGLSDQAQSVLTVIEHTENNEIDPRPFAEFAAQATATKNKLWDSMEADAVKPIVNETRGRLGGEARHRIKITILSMLADVGGPYNNSHGIVDAGEIYVAVVGEKLDPMPQLASAPANNTALAQDAASEKRLSPDELGPVIEAAIQQGFKQGAASQSMDAQHSFDIAYARICEITDTAGRQKYLDSLAFYENNAHLFDSALRTTRDITDPKMRGDHLMFIGEYQAGDDPSGAKSTYQEAARTALEIKDPTERDKELSQICFYQNMSRFPEEAQNTLSMISSPEIKEKTANSLPHRN